jgi:hypothetical protein
MHHLSHKNVTSFHIFVYMPFSFTFTLTANDRYHRSQGSRGKWSEQLLTALTKQTEDSVHCAALLWTATLRKRPCGCLQGNRSQPSSKHSTETAVCHPYLRSFYLSLLEKKNCVDNTAHSRRQWITRHNYTLILIVQWYIKLLFQSLNIQTDETIPNTRLLVRYTNVTSP